MEIQESPLGPAAGFFVAGGTMPLGSASYLERSADRQLLDSLLAGRFCYVLNSRQMGKSSLCVRTMSRLSAQGVACAFIDITRLGGRNVTPEQWYAGMALEIGRSTGLRKEILEYWKSEAGVGPMQRFFGALRSVVLEASEGRFVVFVDEIDSTRSLSFSTDEFFAGVRECFNRRVQDPEFERLTFCFLGVAVPSDLIQDARTTPFNIGDRIYLKDFTLEEAMPLAAHLGPHGEEAIRRVHHWTNGHPYLTQSLCRALMQHPSPRASDVDAMVRRDLLEPKVRETNINLSDVGNRVLNGYADGEDVDSFRADILSAYQKALSGRERLLDDESNRIAAVLKLSGLMRSEGRHLLVRNRIYERVFGKEWIAENMPEQEVRRQRRAFRGGVLRTSAVAAVVLSVISTLAVVAVQNADRARKAEEAARYDAYVSSMRNLYPIYQRHDLTQISAILDRFRDYPGKGWEWHYWNRVAAEGDPITTGIDGIQVLSLSPDGRLVAVIGLGEATIVELASRKTTAVLKAPENRTFSTSCAWSKDARRVYTFDSTSVMTEWDAWSGRPLRSRDFSGRFTNLVASNAARSTALLRNTREGTTLVDLERLVPVREGPDPDDGLNLYAYSRDGARLAVMIRSTKGTTRFAKVYDAQTYRLVARWPRPEPTWAVGTSPNGDLQFVGGRQGEVRVFDVETGRTRVTINAPIGDVSSIQMSPDRRWLLVGDWIRQAALIDLTKPEQPTVKVLKDVGGAAFLPNGKEIVWGYNGVVRTLSLESINLDKDILLGSWFYYGQSSFGRTGRLMAGDGLSLRFLDPLNPESRTQDAHSGIRNGVDLSGHELKVQYVDGLARIFRSGGVLVASVPTEVVTEVPAPFESSPDGNWVAIMVGNTEIALVDLRNGRYTKRDLQGVGRYLSFSRDGTKVIAAITGKIGAYRVPDLAPVWEEAAASLANTISTSPDGVWAAISCADDRILLRRVQDGRAGPTLRGHTQSVYGSGWSPDSKRLVSGSEDTTVRLWDPSTGRELGILGEHKANLVTVAFIDQGRTIASLSGDGEVKLWRMAPRERK